MIVATGMSGGVDSTMAAWLLKQQGHEVIGVTMRIYDSSVPIPDNGRSGCYGPAEARTIAAAKEAAEQIGVPHFVIPLEAEFKHWVLKYFRSEYRSGHTPNPCVVCNHKIKFGLLPEKAEQLGIKFDAFATGHYVIKEFDSSRNIYRLFRGADPKKDQSYFLFHLAQAQLKNTLFPLGAMTKDEIIAQARKAGFKKTAARKQSQDFINSDNYPALFAESDMEPGPITDTSGRLLGQHKGIVRYTIGQREGLGVASTERLYVKHLDAETNTVILGRRDEIMSASCRIKDPSWIAEHPPEDGTPCLVRPRYRHPGAKAIIHRENGKTWRIDFQEPQFALTPGQAAVCYAGNEMLGGGWIDAI